MIYYEIQDLKGNNLAGNMHEFSRAAEFRDKKSFSSHFNGKGIKSIEEDLGDIKVWVLVENEGDLLKSSKLFKKTLELYKTISLQLYKHYLVEVDAHGHMLTTIQAQIMQQIDMFADNSEFYGDSFSESVAKVSRIVEGDKESAARLICYIKKRMTDMRAHLLGVEIIHSGEQYEIKPVVVSLKRAILNQYAPFSEEFDESAIRIRFYFDESSEIEVDKNMFSLIMYNFFSNAVKYAKPNSEIRLNYVGDDNCLDVSMISLKMERDEINDLFNQGVRGRHAEDIPGKGIGLFVIRKSLELMEKKLMYISPEYGRNYNEDGFVYIENHFKFWF